MAVRADRVEGRKRVNAALASRPRGRGRQARHRRQHQLRSRCRLCFGGGNVLESARSGSDVNAAEACPHGDLETTTAKAGDIKAAVSFRHPRLEGPGRAQGRSRCARSRDGWFGRQLAIARLRRPHSFAEAREPSAIWPNTTPPPRTRPSGCSTTSSRTHSTRSFELFAVGTAVAPCIKHGWAALYLRRYQLPISIRMAGDEAAPVYRAPWCAAAAVPLATQAQQRPKKIRASDHLQLSVLERISGSRGLARSRIHRRETSPTNTAPAEGDPARLCGGGGGPGAPAGGYDRNLRHPGEPRRQSRDFGDPDRRHFHRRSGARRSRSKPGASRWQRHRQHHPCRRTGPKRLQLVKEIIPSAKRVALLGSGAHVQHDDPRGATRRRVSGSNSAPLEARRAAEFSDAFATLAREAADAAPFTSDAVHQSNIQKIVSFQFQQGLPGMFQSRDDAVAGGLMSYGASFPAMFRQGAFFARSIDA